MKRFYLTLCIAIAFFVLSCETEPDPVVFSSFEPTSGDYGSEIIIRGSQFSANSSIVKFGTLGAEIISASATELVVTVPVGATTGKISVEANGQQVTSNEVFTVTAGAWQSKAGLNKTMSSLNHIFFTIGDNAYIHIPKITVSGTPRDAEFWEYNSASNTWTKKTELSKDQIKNSSWSWGTKSKGYILQYSKLWEYNPSTDQWTLKKALPVIFSSTTIRCTFYISSVNLVFAIMNNGYFLSYDPETDTWSQTPQLPFSFTNDTPISQGTATKGYFKNGLDVWEFDPTNNQWMKLPAFPSTSYVNFSLGIGNSIYLGTSTDPNFWVYQPSLNKWIQKAELNSFRHYPLYFSIGDKGYVGFGTKITSDLPHFDFYEYNP